MKKVLLALSALGVFALAGCSSDSDSNGNGNGNGNGQENGGNNIPAIVAGGTKIDLANSSTLEGTYRIEYFASTATAGGASSDWSKLDTYKSVLDETKSMKKGSGSTFPDAKGNFYGQVTIKLNSQNLEITSKLQMKDKSFEQVVAGIDLKEQQYNYTKYTSIPTDKIATDTKTINKGDNAVKGVTGRTATSTKKSEINASGNKANTYMFKLHTDGKLYHYMKDNSSLLPADVLVVLTKVSDTVETLNENQQYSYKGLDLGNYFKTTPDSK